MATTPFRHFIAIKENAVGDQTIPADTDTLITFERELVDVGGRFDRGLSRWRPGVEASIKLAVSLQGALYEGTYETPLEVAIRKNGQKWRYRRFLMPYAFSVPPDASLAFSVTDYAHIGDYYDVWLRSSENGVTIFSDIATPGTACWFEGFVINSGIDEAAPSAPGSPGFGSSEPFGGSG